jgi:hypothetical protein
MCEPNSGFFVEQYKNFVHYLVMESNSVLCSLDILVFVYLLLFYYVVLSLNQLI